MAVKTFTQGEQLTAADTNTYLANGGLVYITQASLSAVTNSISNVFSSTFDAYRIVVSNLENGSGTTRTLTLRFRTTSDDTTANYFFGQYGHYFTNQFQGSNAGQAQAELGAWSGGANNGGSITIDIVNPYVAKATTFSGFAVGYQSNVGYYVQRVIYGGTNTTTQYTGFSIIGITDNLSGTVRVYGYRQA